jgi:hypothetical protein
MIMLKLEKKRKELRQSIKNCQLYTEENFVIERAQGLKCKFTKVIDNGLLQESFRAGC